MKQLIEQKQVNLKELVDPDAYDLDDDSDDAEEALSKDVLGRFHKIEKLYKDEFEPVRRNIYLILMLLRMIIKEVATNTKMDPNQ